MSDDPALSFLTDIEVSRRLAADDGALLDYVADQIGTALPNHVRVKRKGFFNTGAIVSVTVVLGTQHFELSRAHGHIEATTGAVSGGVVLHHEPLPTAEWVQRLLAGLAALAAHSDSVHAALLQLR